jgi:predicted permease
MGKLLRRVAYLFRQRRLEAELAEEIEFHREMKQRELEAEGMSPAEAHVRSRQAVGSSLLARESARAVWVSRWIDEVLQDLRYGWRGLRRTPGFTFVAVLMLALGIGANTAIFSVVNALLLRPMPVIEPDRLIRISRGEEAVLSLPVYREVSSGTQALRAVAATLSMESDLEVDGDSHFAAAEFVTANYADVLGVSVSFGRWFVGNREPAAVISDAVWERQFARTPQVLGRVIRSGTDAYTIVGVARPEFSGVRAPLRTDFWAPIETRFRSMTALEERRIARMVMLFGRLRPGATATQAAAELNALDTQAGSGTGTPALFERSAPISAEVVRALPSAGNQRLVRMLTTLMAAIVAVVLTIACVNVSHQLLARGALRQREFAVRHALGASRARLFRQLLTEALVLAVGGTLCGVVLAVWTGGLLERSLPAAAGIFALQLDLSLDRRALVFAAVICAVTTVLCGLLPAWRTSGMPRLGMVHGIVGTSTRRRPMGLVAQVAMSLVLLFISGSFLAALLRLYATDPGFDTAGRLYAYTFLPSPPFPPDARYDVYRKALDRLRTLPGVRMAALMSSLPLIPAGSDCASLSLGSRIRVTSSAVDTTYFDTMGIERVAGRVFAASDLTDAAASVVVTESLARRLWPDRPAVGERVMIGCDRVQPAMVIGVVRDSAIRAVGESPQPHVYRGFAARHAGTLTAVLVDTTTDPGGLTETVRRTLLSLAPGIRVYTVQPLHVHVERSFGQLRWVASVLIGLGSLALLLAAVGLSGAVAYRTRLRTREIGLRMALGATRRNVLRDVLGNGLAIVLVGVAIGELLTVPLNNAVASLQENVGPTALSTHLAAGLIWIVVGLVASYVPAARAARLDPLVALRCE